MCQIALARRREGSTHALGFFFRFLRSPCPSIPTCTACPPGSSPVSGLTGDTEWVEGPGEGNTSRETGVAVDPTDAPASIMDEQQWACPGV